MVPPLQDAHDQEVSGLCFSGDGNYMATGGADKVVKVWSWTHGNESTISNSYLAGLSRCYWLEVCCEIFFGIKLIDPWCTWASRVTGSVCLSVTQY